VALARLLLQAPPFAFLDQPLSALSPERVKQLYQALARTAITYLSVGDHVQTQEYHDALLDLHEDGSWEVRPVKALRSA
jgi:putative ATP-binding cassette transporter